MNNNAIKASQKEEFRANLPLLELAIPCFSVVLVIWGEEPAGSSQTAIPRELQPHPNAAVFTFDLQMHIIFLEITDVGKQAFPQQQHSWRMSLNTLSSTLCLHRVIQGK